jgi:hypothetical protein
MVDFSVPFPALLALVLGCGMPCYLYVAARVPSLAGRNAPQFLVAFLFMLLFWAGLDLLESRIAATDILEPVVALCILGSASLFYLEIWALLSRGYTLGLLLTLYRAKKPLSEEELAACYRSGEGISWIMKHRLSGLTAAGLVTIRDGRIVLTPILGVMVAWLYQIAMTTLGLRKTG